MSTLPAETTPTDLELAFYEAEPPGLFPQNQDSYWGQLRKVVTDKLQEIADLFAVYYLNQSAETVSEDDMREWEEMLGIPAATTRTASQRRSFILSRLAYGAFTRTRRRLLVESFILATFGTPISFTPGGVEFVSGGIPFFVETTNLAGTYNIVENIGAFSYDVRVLNTLGIDVTGLQRELARITPAGITFTITLTAAP